MKRLIAILFVLTILLTTSFCAFADNEKQIKTIELSEKQKNESWENLEFSKEETPAKDAIESPICSFAITDSGYIILALENRRIVVCESSGTPVSMFSFASMGSFHVDGKGDNYILYKVRSDTAYEITIEGDLVDIEKWDMDDEYTDDVYSLLSNRKSIEKDGAIYELKKPKGLIGFFMGNEYHSLSKSDSSGEQTLLEIDSGAKTNHYGFVVGFLVFYFGGQLFLGSIVLVEVIRRRKKKRQSGDGSLIDKKE